MKPILNLPLQVVYDQPCFCIQTEQINLAITRFGGQMAPVEFYADTDTPIMPYHIAPWWDKGLSADHPPLLHILRGDFFCCPFGGNETIYNGVQYPTHGESANRPWTLMDWQEDFEGAFLHLSQVQNLLSGNIEKKIYLIEGQNLVYSSHILSDMEGLINPGHHANLRFPDSPHSGRLAFSPFIHAQVYVQPTERPENKGYSILQPGAVITDLTNVPTITGEFTDLTTYPARRGFEDIVILCSDPSLDFAWSSVTFPEGGYLWLALKDPKILTSTLLWMSNGGRHYEPWNGRHVNVMGLEDITAFFHEGISESVNPNHLNDLGIPTAIPLTPEKPTSIHYIQGVVRIPKRFDRVADIKRRGENELVIISQNGRQVTLECKINFLYNGSTD